MVSRLVRDQEASSSNLDTPTTVKKPQSLDTIDFAALHFLLFFCISGVCTLSDHYFDHYGTHNGVLGGFFGGWERLGV